jgi:phage terminase large subunit-like protein
MTLIPGSRIEQGVIRNEILDLSEQFQIIDIAYDPWNGEALRQDLEADGLEMIEFHQNMKNFNEPLKELLALISERKLRHGGHPVLRWMASNLATKEDGSGNIRPDKKESGDKIDGIVALIMALARATFSDGELVSDYQYGDLSL